MITFFGRFNDKASVEIVWALELSRFRPSLYRRVIKSANAGV